MSDWKNKKAVVLLSGGIDSSTTMAIAKAEGYEIYALSFDYSQRHKRELVSAKKVASSVGVEKHLIIKFDLREIGGSALTSEMEVPKNSFKFQVSSFKFKNTEDSELRTLNSELIPVTYVPARNTIFLSFALAWAEVLEVENIFIGANAVDYSGYPDCRPEYLRAFEDMANLATKASVEGRLRFMIRAPLISMKKSEIIKKGIELGLDYSLTWSCYEGGESPCGRCDSCVFRAKGFREAGIRDPLVQD
ncbi:MAG: 7-cyano-7-deazaguanine synthase QueC [Nitrospirae bacterium]|nr:7-cyano-7-deazaguanine synthase QueC [Nitrospirota bacterium]